MRRHQQGVNHSKMTIYVCVLRRKGANAVEQICESYLIEEGTVQRETGDLTLPRKKKRHGTEVPCLDFLDISQSPDRYPQSLLKRRIGGRRSCRRVVTNNTRLV
jgi:hypothetical protein